MTTLLLTKLQVLCIIAILFHVQNSNTILDDQLYKILKVLGTTTKWILYLQQYVFFEEWFLTTSTT